MCVSVWFVDMCNRSSKHAHRKPRTFTQNRNHHQISGGSSKSTLPSTKSRRSASVFGATPRYAGLWWGPGPWRSCLAALWRLSLNPRCLCLRPPATAHADTNKDHQAAPTDREKRRKAARTGVREDRECLGGAPSHSRFFFFFVPLSTMFLS